MTKISGNTPHIPQTDTPQAPVEKTGVAAPQSGQAPAVKDEVGDIPGAPTAQHQVDLPPEEAISSLKSLAQNMNTSDHGNVSSRGDVDIAVDPNANFDMNSLPGTLNASAGMIEQDPALVSTTLNSVNSSLQQSQQASYGQVFQQGTYQPGTVFSGGTTLSDSLSGSGSSMSLNASAQRTLENLCSEGLPTDPMAFVQFVLRESYLETTNVLMDHANKVRFFNDVKKEIRAKAQQLRDVLAQHAGAGDTDVIGNTQTEDINQSFYGQTSTTTSTTNSRTTPPAITPETTGLTQEELDTKNAEYHQAVQHNVVEVEWTPDPYSRTINYGDSDEYSKFDDHGRTTGEDIAKSDVASMTPSQQEALLEHYKENGLHVDLVCEDTDKTDNTYHAKSGEKTYPRDGESLEDFIERAVEEQTAQFKNYVIAEEGDINIASISTSIDYPTVTITDTEASWKPESFSEQVNYGDSDDYGKFNTHGKNTGASASSYAAGMEDYQQEALLEHYKENGLHVDLVCEDTDKTDNTYTADSNVKTYPKDGESLEDFMERAVTEQSATFKAEVKKEEGNINIESITTTIAPPSVTVNTGGQSAEEIAADHEFSTDAQNTITNAPTSTTTNSSSDVSLGQNVTTKAEHENALEKYEQQLNSVGDDAQLANVDLQNWLQKQQQTMQMMSNISKLLHDTAMAIIRKIG